MIYSEITRPSEHLKGYASFRLKLNNCFLQNKVSKILISHSSSIIPCLHRTITSEVNMKLVSTEAVTQKAICRPNILNLNLNLMLTKTDQFKTGIYGCSCIPKSNLTSVSVLFFGPYDMQQLCTAATDLEQS